MISQKLVHLIETHADEIARRWLKDVRQNQDTPSYHKFPEAPLHARAFDIYSHLSRWVGREEERSREEVRDVYLAFGAERSREGFRLSEVVKDLILVKRHLWLFVMEQGLFDSAVELYQVLELYNSVVLFFDRAIHFTVQGYENETRVSRRQTA